MRDVPIQVLDRTRHDLGVPFRLARVMRAFRPDLVHCRNWNTWPDTVMAHQLAGRPGVLVWSFHGFADGHWFPRRRKLASRLLSLATDKLFAVCRDSAERFAGCARSRRHASMCSITASIARASRRPWIASDCAGNSALLTTNW